MSSSVRGADVKIALVGGLAVTALAVTATLLHAPSIVAATNSIARTTRLVVADTGAGACQGNEAPPRGTSAIRLALSASFGPRVNVTALSGSRVIARGTQETGWVGGDVTVPIGPVRRAYSHVTVCFQITRLTGSVAVVGEKTPPAVAATAGGEALPGRLRIEYLRPGRPWLSVIPAVLRHMGLGRAAAGAWIAVPIGALAAAAAALASWAVLRELR
jgi:hypothetical protein